MVLFEKNPKNGLLKRNEVVIKSSTYKFGLIVLLISELKFLNYYNMLLTIKHLVIMLKWESSALVQYRGSLYMHILVLGENSHKWKITHEQLKCIYIFTVHTT